MAPTRKRSPFCSSWFCSTCRCCRCCCCLLLLLLLPLLLLLRLLMVLLLLRLITHGAAAAAAAPAAAAPHTPTLSLPTWASARARSVRHSIRLSLYSAFSFRFARPFLFQPHMSCFPSLAPSTFSKFAFAQRFANSVGRMPLQACKNLAEIALKVAVSVRHNRLSVTGSNSYQFQPNPIQSHLHLHLHFVSALALCTCTCTCMSIYLHLPSAYAALVPSPLYLVIEKYSERSQILLNPPGRMLIVTYRTPLGVWLGPGGRRFEPPKSHF